MEIEMGKKALKILHFADAHIDIAQGGKHDAASGLPVRVVDFLKALDTIIDAAISEKVDLVIFAGDAYKDRLPAPTFQREWGRRIMRLSNANIPTLLLVGNHDLSPSSGRAHTLQEFDTLEVPNVRVLGKPEFLKPADLWNLPLQVLALPWVFRSGLMATLDLAGADAEKINDELEVRLTEILQEWMNQLDPALPTILVAHGSVQGALYGNERTVMLGKDIVFPGSLVKDPRLDYVALGHIHKHQDLNAGAHPPVVYAGSIERVDFGEAADDKYYIIASVQKGKTTYTANKLNGRKFIDKFISVKNRDEIIGKVSDTLPSPKQLKDAIFRLTVEYPRDLDMFLDEPLLREHCASALEFHLVRRPLEEARLRLPSGEALTSLSPLQLLDSYWKSTHTEPGETESLQTLAGSIIQSVDGEVEIVETEDKI
jgi:DNA repair protein SbcD/Mre11